MVKAMLSAVVPAYNEEIMVPRATRVIGRVLRDAEIDYEIVFVNDGSKDGTWEQIEAESRENPAVRGVCFSRNFGKEAAIMAGLAAAKGDCVVVLDCDLQHPPEKIVEMYRLWQQGYEVVEGQKSSRGKESAAHAWAARSFYSIISAAVGFDMSKASDFKLLDRKAVNVLLNMRESNAFFRALSSWIGFRTAVVPFDVQEREAGVSKWSTKALVKYAVSNITSFSTLPMQLITLLGVVVFVVSCVLGGHCAGSKIYRPCAGRLYHCDSDPAVLQQRDHDQSGHHRLLHRPHLRRDQGPPPLHCGEGVRRRKTGGALWRS